MSKSRLYAKLAAVAGLVAIGAVAVWQLVGNSHQSVAQAAPPPPATVDVAEVVSRKVIDWQSYSGRLEAIDRVEVRPQVSGILTTVHFKDGQLVKKGDPLFTIDPRPFAAEVARAEAQLTAAKARVAYTASDLARSQRLIADNAIARRDFEEKENAAREAAANLQAAEAGLRTAKLNLEYTQIVAPIDGQISRAEVTAGNVVAAGAASQPLTTLVSVSRIYAAFDVDEQSFLKFVNAARVGGSAAHVPVYLGLANEEGFSRQGQVQSVDNRLDVTSGTIRVRATFENGDGLLVPGLYARIKIGGGAEREALLVDERAIGTDQDKRFVMALNEQGQAMYREVKLGAVQDGLRVVESGLEAGERIVVNGLQRVRPGDRVTPRLVSMASIQK